MNRFLVPRSALALRLILKKLHLSSLTPSAPRTFGLLLIIIFGLAQLPKDSAAKAPRKARLTFYGSEYRKSPAQDVGFGQPSGIGSTTGKLIRKVNDGDTLYSWQFPQTIGPEGAKFQIGVAARANEKGGGVSAVISCLGIPVQEQTQSSEVGVGAKPGEGLKKASLSYTIVPYQSYESKEVTFMIRCHGGGDILFHYQVEQ